MSSHPDMAKRLDQRYGAQPKPHDLRWNDTIDTLLAHRSVRAYLPDALPDGTVETLVAAAQSASTSSNLHQWSVVSVTDRELRKRIAAASRTGLEDNLYVEQAPVFLLWVADLSRNHALALDAGAEPVVHTYLDAFVMATIDAALAAQNAVIAA
ncbi:nitroreductase family protein [Pseudomonadota bacterium AL_CKDN230030165-1A_HGKHYDSX7]